jgi:hypothetical protein
MGLAKCQYAEDFTRKVTETQGKKRSYEIIWTALVADTDATEYSGAQILEMARAATPGANFDFVPKIGRHYSLLGFSDNTAEVTSMTCELASGDNPKMWTITASYGNEDSGDGNLLGPAPPPDPLKWPVIHWIETIEEDKVIERAICLTELDHLKRGPNFFNTFEPGPIINAAGQQTVDPKIESYPRIVLNSLVYYPNMLYGLSIINQFTQTIHGPADFLSTTFPDPEPEGGTFPRFMGFPHFQWKFLGVNIEKPKYKEIVPTEEEGEGEPEPGDPNTVEYVETTIQLEYKAGNLISFRKGGDITPYLSGWIDLVLNNGQTCFAKWMNGYESLGEPQEEWVMDPRFPNHDDQDTGTKMLLPTRAKIPSSSIDFSYEDTRADKTSPRLLTEDDLEDVETSEPVNLKQDGTQITDPTEPANHIQYLTKDLVNYYHITDYFGVPIYPENFTLYNFPLSPP